MKWHDLDNLKPTKCKDYLIYLGDNIFKVAFWSKFTKEDGGYFKDGHYDTFFGKIYWCTLPPKPKLKND